MPDDRSVTDTAGESTDRRASSTAADHAEERYPGVVEAAQGRDGPLEIRQPRPAVVEQVAGVDDGVNLVGHRVVDHLLEGGEEVLASLRRVVLPVADVGVGRVDNPRHARR